MWPSKHNAQKVSFRTQYSKCPSEHEAGIETNLQVAGSETYPYPYPKGDHNGAVGPKYASIVKYQCDPLNITS